MGGGEKYGPQIKLQDGNIEMLTNFEKRHCVINRKDRRDSAFADSNAVGRFS